MFFFLRSAVCIGLVVAALPDNGRPPATAVATQPTAAAMQAAALAGAARLCRAAPDRCRAVLGGSLKAGAPAAYALLADLRRPPPSRDTLSADDRTPGWAGPVLDGTD